MSTSIKEAIEKAMQEAPSTAHHSPLHLRDMFGVKEPTLAWINVSPEIATAMLERNTHNRRIRKSHVAHLASEMLSGYWRDTPQSICFSTEGVLMDGQHRLLAVIASKKTILMRVFFGEDPETFNVLDVGIKRQMGDVLTLSGIQNGAVIAASVKVELNIRKGNYSHDSRVYSVTDVLTALEGPSFGNIYAAVQIGNKCSSLMHKRGVLNCGVHVAAFRILNANPKKPIQVEQFFERLGNGFGITDSSDPVCRLRTRIIDSKTRAGRVELAALIIKAWNADSSGRRIGKLSWANNEEFPTARAV